MLKRKIIPVFLASVLAVSGTTGFSVGVFSENVYASEEAHTQRLEDFADLLDADQKEELEVKLDQISENYDCDVVVDIEESIDGMDPTAYADDFFDYNDYGMGNDKSGILFMLTMSERKWAISTHGEAISIFTDAGQEYITDYIGDVKYQISPLSFYQVNPVQTNVLYGQALEYAGLTGNETVWDVYCGIGTISLFLAQKAKKVYGVEIVPQAIEDAKRNAEINGIQNAEFYVGKAEEVLPDYYAAYAKEHPGENAHADVIVVDPPRKGCEESVLSTMVNMGPDRIVYVSCDSATLARDLKYLCENGYGLEKVRAVDMFPMTGHVETVCCLHRVNS